MKISQTDCESVISDTHSKNTPTNESITGLISLPLTPKAFNTFNIPKSPTQNCILTVVPSGIQISLIKYPMKLITSQHCCEG